MENIPFYNPFAPDPSNDEIEVKLKKKPNEREVKQNSSIYVFATKTSISLLV